MSSYKLKKVATHPSGMWTLYALQTKQDSKLLETSPSDGDAEYRRLDATRHESRERAIVKRKNKVSEATEKTTGDLSF